MTRVVLVTPAFSGHDGLSCLSRQLHQALTALGAAVEVISLGDSPHVADAVATAGGDRLRYGLAVLHAAASNPSPALTVVAHLHLLPTVWPLIARGTTVVPVLVGIESWRPLTATRTRVMRRVPRAIAISHHTAREFRRANPNFADLPVDVCWPATPSIAADCDTAQRAGDPFALIVGRLAAEERYKGHDLLIDVWPQLQAAVPRARLVVAGTGDDLPRLRARVDAAGVHDAIIFEGQVTTERLSQLYRQAAFLVLPSRHEGFGYVLLEAMSAGRACIAALGAAEEIIEPNLTGLIVDPAHAHTLLEAMTTLFQDEALRQRLGAAGQERAARVFSMRRFTADLAQSLAPWLPSRAVAVEC
ncbi:MAG TPA: glycosyltransferase family 4 protein [Vicinamibacterales bacterium]|nr:glycosyltransferase family 4 protein [Vicinamibacterales bacterium]